METLPTPPIEFDRVSRIFDSPERRTAVLEEASWRIEPGSFLALVGRSGTGKSTVLNLIAGLDQPSGGQVRAAGRDLTTFSDGKRARYLNEDVGFIFQSFYLRPRRTALDSVMLPMLIGQASVAEARNRARAALEKVGLGEMTGSICGRLSGGQRQRVAIARAIANRPRLLLADEPTGHLDTETSHEVLRLLADYNRQSGASIVLVTHDPLIQSLALPMWHIVGGKIEPYEGRI